MKIPSRQPSNFGISGEKFKTHQNFTFDKLGEAVLSEAESMPMKVEEVGLKKQSLREEHK